MTALLKRLLSRFGETTKARPASEHDIHLATATLLVEVARADFHDQAEEIRTMVRLIADRFALSEQEARALLDEAEKHQDQQVSLFPIVEIINKNCTVGEKREILLDCWRIAYADDKLDRYEDHHVRKIAELLHLSHADFIQTKLKAEAESQKRNGSRP